MGNPDPSRVIVAETNRVPFKESNLHPGLWDKRTALRNWPSIILGWRNWLIKVATKKRVDWTTRNLDQCISLSLSDIRKNELMLKAACFFWSNSYNAFLFRQGLMSPTLADVHMLTGLNIVGHINPFSLLVKPTAKLDSTKTRGWSQYIINHKADDRSVSGREHTTFLNMWLDIYIFCGQACSPISNYLTLVERISSNSEIPLGKILLGALYNLLNRVSQHLMENKTIPTITGPWCLLHLWLNLHLHKLVAPELVNLSFPSKYPEEQEEKLPKG
jgi:hypothetical protein